MADTIEAGTLLDRRTILRQAEPKLYARDQATRLGISESELVGLDEGRGATRLRPDFAGLLSGLHRLGPVMALTRNADAVHEKTGTYGALEGGGHVRLFLGELIDLRLFLHAWAYGWAVQSPAGRRSLQFYGKDGAAVHKVFATEATDLEAWMALVADFTAPASLDVRPVAPLAPAKPRRSDAEVDVALFHAEWDALRDTHDFHGLLMRHKLARTQALHLAGPVRARPVRRDSLRDVLLQAASTALPIMVFVGNQGCIQIHTGPVETVRESGPWFNVLDPGFNLHLREDSIDTAWVVAKPTDDGPVTSLELFDAGGNIIATLFGKRKPGNPEDLAWRALANALPGL